jgi:hypothetical protein
MVEDFELETFSGRAGETFRLLLDDGSTVDLELVSVTPGVVTPNDPSGMRAPFSVIFRGPLEPVMPQRIYRVEHDELGSFELFVVPVGSDELGMQYQAVFG